MIVLEGPDNSGKSTFAAMLAQRTGRRIQGSEGPPKPGESINDRIRRYSALVAVEPMIFDRHPVISQPIYSMLAGNPQQVEPELIAEFYDSRPTLVYCDPGERGMEGHIEKPEHDCPEHIEQVHKHYYDLLNAYREWALKHAQFVYRISDGPEAACRLRDAIIAHRAWREL